MRRTPESTAPPPRFILWGWCEGTRPVPLHFYQNPDDAYGDLATARQRSTQYKTGMTYELLPHRGRNPVLHPAGYLVLS